MAYEKSIISMALDAQRLVEDGSLLGLGSGRAATAFVRELANSMRTKPLSVRGIPTSLQIRMVAEEEGIPLVDAQEADTVDAVFDGADQIDEDGYIVKGGGGALLRENILYSLAKKTVIMADRTKFVKKITMPIPVEVHPSARTAARTQIEMHGGTARVRTVDRGYPFFTENGNIILDCDFGVVHDPQHLSDKLIRVAGVLEVGLFRSKPDIIYRADERGFELVRC